jgi:hypothetical protein
LTEVPFPLLTSPGLEPQLAGGRLLNTYPEKLPASAGKGYAWFRVPGLGIWATAPSGRFRGGVQVNNLFYGVFGTAVYSWTSAGGVGTLLTGSVPGSDQVFAVRNNATNPDVVFVSVGNGAFWINGANQVVSYPDADVGQPNSVVFHKGFFIFTYGNGVTRASGVNVTAISTLDVATAESKPDTLYRPVPLGNGQLLLCGSTSLEVWGGANDSGYPFSYIATIARGLVGPAAIAGHEDGFGKGLFLVGDDFRVSRLDDYSCTPISNSDLDTQIERDPNKIAIRVSVFNSRGHGFVVVQGTNWCWIFDTTLNTWHERLSYLKTYWRGIYSVQAFGRWLVGDTDSAVLAEVNANIRKELGVNDVQTVTITGTPTGGTFTLTFNGQTTAAIAYNASAAALQTALQALARIGSGNIDCTSGPLPGTAVAVRFKDALGVAPQPVMSASSALTGGSSPAISIAHTTTGAYGDPIMMRVETGPFGAFPNMVRINAIEVYLTKGASDATGLDPQETDVSIAISISRNGGQDWSNPRAIKIGRQAITNGRVRSSIWGQADVQGVRWRFEESAGVDFAFMGADMAQDVLR